MDPRHGEAQGASGIRRWTVLALTVSLVASGLLLGLGGVPAARGETLRPGPGPPAGSSGPDRRTGAPLRGAPASPAASSGPEYRVARTLVLPNDSLRSGAFHASNGLNPEALVYDSQTGALFVANTVSNSITVVNGTTGAIVGSVAVGPEPASLAYDPSLGTVYVANGSYASVTTGQSSIWAFNATTYRGTAIPTGAEPNAVAYDPTNEEVFVANSGANTVTVINATNDTPTATVPVPSSAWGIAYDPWLNEVVVVLTETDSIALIDAGNLTLRATVKVGEVPYVATAAGPSGAVVVGNEGSNNVTLLNGSSGKILASVAVGSYPDGLQYDSATDEVFVANGNSNNVSVLNISRERVVGTIPIGAGSGPDALALNPVNETLYVADGNSNAVTFANASTDTVGRSYLLGLQPVAATFDPVQNALFLGDSSSDLVSVVNLTATRITGNISVPDDPAAGAFDPVLDEVAIAESNGSDLAVIDGANSTLVGQISVGADPDAVAYAADLGEWIVADSGSGTVSIVNATDGQSVANLTVGVYPDSIALVPGRPLAIVANGFSDNLSVINLTSNRVATSLSGGPFPADVTFDAETHQIVVADSLSGELEAWNLTGGNFTSASVGAVPASLAVDAATGVWISVDESSDSLVFVSAANRTVEETLTVGSGPTQAVVDPETGSIYVVNLGAASLMVVVPQLYLVTAGQFGLPAGTLWSVTLAGGPTIDSTGRTMEWSATNGSYVYTVASSYPDRIDPAPGRFDVAGSPANLSFLFRQPFNVSVAETGNPLGSSWWLNLSNGQSFESRQNSFTFGEVNGSYRFLASSAVSDLAPVAGWLNLSGAPVTLQLEFRVQYPVTLVVSGITPGANWSLTLSNGVRLTSLGSSVSLALVNGTYGYRVSAPAQGLLPVLGNFTVAGVPLALSIQFEPFRSPVTFGEQGLPVGMGWAIHFENGTTLAVPGSSATVDQANGSYTFTVTAGDPSYGAPGRTYRVDGTPVTVDIAFHRPRYSVQFVPSGLPEGSAWWLSISGENRTPVPGGPLTLLLPNGTYTVRAGSANGSYSVPAHLWEVDGRNQTAPLGFVPVEYPVAWIARGISSGIAWSLTVGGQSFPALGANLTLDLMNGSYRYSIRSPAGYTPASSSGVVSVSGRPESITLRFQAPPAASSGTLGIPPVLLGVALAALAGGIVMAVAYAGRIRRGRPRGGVWEPPRRRLQ